jgi:hypothetical protein
MIDSTASRILALRAAVHLIASPHFGSFAPAHPGIRPAHSAGLGAGSDLVVLVLQQDVERGERAVTARNILLQVELVRFAQFAWHAVASAKPGRSRSPSARERADYSES